VKKSHHRTVHFGRLLSSFELHEFALLEWLALTYHADSGQHDSVAERIDWNAWGAQGCLAGGYCGWTEAYFT
jgi:hypothetical protein